MALLNQETIYNRKGNKVKLYKLSGQEIKGKHFQSNNWHSSIKLSKNPVTRKSTPLIRFSTGQSDIEDATEAAMSKFWDLFERHKKNLPLSNTKFSTICKKFIEKLDSERRYLEDHNEGHYTKLSVVKKIQTVERFLIPYFGDFDIEDISDFDIKKFKNHRMTDVGGKSKKTQISTGTLNKTLTVFRQIFRYANDKGYIESVKVPIVTNKIRPKDEVTRNPDFSPKEYKKLASKAYRDVKTEKHSHIKNQKFLLQHLILVLANTGARMSEIRNLRWSDIVVYTEKGWFIPSGGGNTDAYLKDKEYIKIQFYGKVSRSTQKKWSSPVQRVRDVLDRLKTKQKQWAKDNNWIWNDECKVFTNHLGSEVVNFNKGFNSLLERTGLTYKNMGETDDGEIIFKKRNLGGLRHLYAKRMLSQGWDYFLLAKNMRTSPQMLNKFYANEIDVDRIPVKILEMRRSRSPVLGRPIS